MPDQVSAHTRKVGLIGWPVEHSGSPRMHNAAFRQADMDWVYLPLPVPDTPAERIREAVEGLRGLGFVGANVTIPHKQSVMPWLSRISETARVVGAVNTITVEEDGSLQGDNTDVYGFMHELWARSWSPRGSHVLVLGAGGSARSVVYGLAQAGCESITVYNRTLSRANDLIAEIGRYAPQVKCQTLEYGSPIQAVGDWVSLVVNTTSLGMAPLVDSCPVPPDFKWHAGMWAYDLVYNPLETQFLALARSAGASCISGLEMLLFQGARSYEIWTDSSPDIQVMRSALYSHLGIDLK